MFYLLLLTEGKQLPMHAIFRFLFLLFFAFGASAHSSEAVRIGATLSLTGKYAELGAMNEKAYRLWERDVNQKGGLAGRPVKVTLLDDKSDPEYAKILYRQLITQDRVDLVLGPYSSEITEAVSTVTEEFRYPLLASGASAVSIWSHGRKYVFGVYITADKYTVGFLELLVKSGLTKVAIVSADDIFSKSIEAGTKSWARRYGLDIVFSETFKKGSAQIDQSIESARRSGAEAVMVAGYFDDAVNGRKALKKINWTPKAYYATVGPAIQKYYDVLKEDAELTYSSSQWEPDLPFPGGRTFTHEFKDAYGVAPSYHAASAYAAGQILEAAVRKAKSLDRIKLRATLSTLDTITVLGRYGVDPDGRQVRHFTTTVQWQKGKKEIVSPSELTIAKAVWR
ncbi:amino acid ABC transporter substrate-binding protein [Oxalobacteraceae bacterium R-40]|uniref:Amino acid ABC transporter substrate-binding protein n=1 Tax=Keguizhuia sedimenti TaxID=3064264 RepID=A0ABU1BR38_9BURK|nr:amino acid ABC transporter substrate-binding protein [Oxalobacteraceae bacterium R-40]